MRIEVLGDQPRVLPGTLRNLSGQGARLQTAERLPVNSMVRIDSYAAIYLGDVCYCYQESGQWQIGVKVAHAIRTERGLKNLAQHLDAESAAALPEPQP